MYHRIKTPATKTLRINHPISNGNTTTYGYLYTEKLRAEIYWDVCFFFLWKGIQCHFPRSVLLWSLNFCVRLSGALLAFVYSLVMEFLFFIEILKWITGKLASWYQWDLSSNVNRNFFLYLLRAIKYFEKKYSYQYINKPKWMGKC